MENATIIFNILQGEFTAPLKVLSKTYESEDYILIGEIFQPDGNQRFQKVSFSLPESLMQQDWVAIYLEADLPETDNIVAISSIEITGVPAGIDKIDSETSITIRPGKGCIEFGGLNGELIQIYTTDGRTVSARKTNKEREIISLQPGMYVCRAGLKTAIVIVN